MLKLFNRPSQTVRLRASYDKDFYATMHIKQVVVFLGDLFLKDTHLGRIAFFQCFLVKVNSTQITHGIFVYFLEVHIFVTLILFLTLFIFPLLGE